MTPRPASHSSPRPAGTPPRSLQLPAERAAVAVGRRFVVELARAVVPCAAPQRDKVLDDAALVASELLANAVTASDEPVEVSVEVTGHVLRVAVSDGADSVPSPRQATSIDPHGRGLAIVEMLARRWGVTRRVDAIGKTVWAEIPLDADLALVPAS